MENKYFGRIVNAHCHVFPDKIAERATASIASFYDKQILYPASCSNLLKDGEKIGTERFLICSTATSPRQVETINLFIKESCEKEKRFVGLGTLHPEYHNNIAETEKIKEYGLIGVKLHPDFQQFNIDDENMIPVYRRLAELKLPILFHMGDNRYDYSSPIRLRRIMDKIDGLVATAAHLGGYCKWDEAKETLADCPDVYFDTCSALPFISSERAMEQIEAFGHKRFFFGTDFPMWDSLEELNRFDSLPLTEAQREDILCFNFKRMVKEKTDCHMAFDVNF